MARQLLETHAWLEKNQGRPLLGPIRLECWEKRLVLDELYHQGHEKPEEPQQKRPKQNVPHRYSQLLLEEQMSKMV
jgi:hypothetical protein